MCSVRNRGSELDDCDDSKIRISTDPWAVATSAANAVATATSASLASAEALALASALASAEAPALASSLASTWLLPWLCQDLTY